MQASSAISVELCDAQPCTIVGSKGTATGVHRTRTRHMKPRTLQEQFYGKISVQSSRDVGKNFNDRSSCTWYLYSIKLGICIA